MNIKFIRCICYAQSTDSDHPRILLRKPRIRALRNNPRIAHANLGSEDLLRKPRIRGFCCTNLGSARNHLGSRNQTSAIRGNKPTIDRARKAARPSAATWVRCSGWPSCFACAIDRGFFAVDGRTALPVRSIVASLTWMVELLCMRDRSWVCCRGWPRFSCAIPEDCVRIRGLRSKKLLCVHDRSWVCCGRWPRFGCAIPEDCVRIRGLHVRS